MLKLTDFPEFMTELRSALATAMQGMNLQAVPVAVDPAEVWLTTQEAMEYLRASRSAFQRFKLKYANELRVHFLMGDPRYQLASLQRLVQENAKGGEEPELALEVQAGRTPKRTPATPTKRRVVTLRMGATTRT